MTSDNLSIWLRERTALGVFSEEIVEAIALLLEPQTRPANEKIITQNNPADGLYILQTGRLETVREIESASGSSQTQKISSLLPGEITLVPELILERPAEKSIIALTECQLLFLPGEEFKKLSDRYPEITQQFTKQLAIELAETSSKLTYERERQTELRPYLITKAKRGVIGKSRYAVRLRQQIREAGGDRQPVLIFGEPGLEKDNLAALIHYGSNYRREPIIQLDCQLLTPTGLELFGRVGGKRGLIETLGEGTLVLNNIQDLPKELFSKICNLLTTNTYTPLDGPGESPPEPRQCLAKILAISEKSLPEINKLVGHKIKAPPLRIRKADIRDYVEYYIRLYCRAKKREKSRITPEALRRLQGYNFPGNIRELETMVERAIVQSSCSLELTEELFWQNEPKKQIFRVNLLNVYPKLRQFLRSPWWPDRINYGFTVAFFAFIVAVLFLGPQTRNDNFALNLFWAWWWPLILLLFPFVGRLWCAVCPFMIYGEITQKLSLWLWPRPLKQWPRQEAEKWGGWFLFGLFALIFLWEELWDLQNTAYLSAWLLLLITAGATICSAIFERRFWCRYLCPIGGMNGLFAKLSMTELRAEQGTCSAECKTYHCYKGGPAEGEGLETNGCPLYSHPAQLEDNRDCVLCMTCLKACPHRSVKVNLRPPGIELWTTHLERNYEVALLFLLFGGIFLHRLPELNNWLNLNIDLTNFWQHLGLSVAALLIPAVICLIAYGAIRLVYQISAAFLNKTLASPPSFLKLAYGYLPLVLGGTLAHYLRLGLGEAGRILPVTLATFGLNGEGLPVWVLHPATIAFLQATSLIFSLILTVVLTQKIARKSMRSLLGQHLAAIVLMASMWSIIVGK
jgi:transcriptional regulator with AAA-type ATPase domain/NAD-dependent dihydropyrimidine dehydrogenase PreA subunit